MSLTRQPRARIAGTGSYVPAGVLTNADLERLVDTAHDWIIERTGINERRIVNNGEVSSDLAWKASRQACERAEVAPAELDLIIVATITPDMIFPSTACVLQEKLGAPQAGAFDLLAACSGFVYALATAAGMISSGMHRNVLVVGAETLSKVTDYTDRSTCILFGDGAGAMVMQPADDGRGVLYTKLRSDGSGGHLMQLPAGGSCNPASQETVAKRLHFMKIQGREVFKFAVNAFKDLIVDAMQKCSLSLDEVALVVPHQVNARIFEAAAKKLELPKERIYSNIDRYGNTSAASVPIAFDEALQEGRLQAGDHVIFVAFGGGLTWGSAVVRL